MFIKSFTFFPISHSRQYTTFRGLEQVFVKVLCSTIQMFAVQMYRLYQICRPVGSRPVKPSRASAMTCPNRTASRAAAKLTAGAPANCGRVRKELFVAPRQTVSSKHFGDRFRSKASAQSMINPALHIAGICAKPAPRRIAAVRGGIAMNVMSAVGGLTDACHPFGD